MIHIKPTMKHLDWDQLRVFLAAHRAGSLRGASENLNVNHATVNRAIRGLEETLGTRIFDRSTGGLTLTQPGEELIEHAEAMEQQTLQISRKLAGLDTEPSGTVRVSIPPSLAHGFIAPILASFTAAYPDIHIEIIGTNRIANLRRQEADISIRVANSVEDDVVGRKLLRYVTGAFATPEYLASHPDLTVGDGTGAHWVGWGKDSTWVKDSPFPNATTRHSLPEILMQIEAAANHIGMVWIPCFFGDADPRLVRIPNVEVKPDRSIWLLLHGDLRKSARVRAFVDHTAAAIRRDIDKYTA